MKENNTLKTAINMDINDITPEEIKDVDAMTAYMQAYREKKYRYYN